MLIDTDLNCTFCFHRLTLPLNGVVTSSLLGAVCKLLEQLGKLQVAVHRGRLAALESKNCAGETNFKKRRRVHNPKLAAYRKHAVFTTQRQIAGATNRSKD